MNYWKTNIIFLFMLVLAGLTWACTDTKSHPLHDAGIVKDAMDGADMNDVVDIRDVQHTGGMDVCTSWNPPYWICWSAKNMYANMEHYGDDVECRDRRHRTTVFTEDEFRQHLLAGNATRHTLLPDGAKCPSGFTDLPDIIKSRGLDPTSLFTVGWLIRDDMLPVVDGKYDVDYLIHKWMYQIDMYGNYSLVCDANRKIKIPLPFPYCFADTGACPWQDDGQICVDWSKDSYYKKNHLVPFVRGPFVNFVIIRDFKGVRGCHIVMPTYACGPVLMLEKTDIEQLMATKDLCKAYTSPVTYITWWPPSSKAAGIDKLGPVYNWCKAPDRCQDSMLCGPCVEHWGVCHQDQAGVTDYSKGIKGLDALCDHPPKDSAKEIAKSFTTDLLHPVYELKWDDKDETGTLTAIMCSCDGSGGIRDCDFDPSMADYYRFRNIKWTFPYTPPEDLFKYLDKR